MDCTLFLSQVVKDDASPWTTLIPAEAMVGFATMAKMFMFDWLRHF